MPFSVSSSLAVPVINNFSDETIVLGHRRYFGHKPTIRPNSKKLYRLFDGRNNMTWEEFSTRVRTFQRGFMGAPKEIRPGRGVFHENPASCICENPDTTNVVSVKRPGKVSSPGKRDVGLLNDYSNVGDDLEWSEPEDEEDIKSRQGHNVYNETSLEDDSVLSEEPELDYLLSD